MKTLLFVHALGWVVLGGHATGFAADPEVHVTQAVKALADAASYTWTCERVQAGPRQATSMIYGATTQKIALTQPASAGLMVRGECERGGPTLLVVGCPPHQPPG